MTLLLGLALSGSLGVAAEMHSEPRGIALEEVLHQLRRGASSVLSDEELWLEDLTMRAMFRRPAVPVDDLVHLHDAGACDSPAEAHLEFHKAPDAEVIGPHSHQVLGQIQPRSDDVFIGGALRRAGLPVPRRPGSPR
jgi:hypothetical protein